MAKTAASLLTPSRLQAYWLMTPALGWVFPLQFVACIFMGRTQDHAPSPIGIS